MGGAPWRLRAAWRLARMDWAVAGALLVPVPDPPAVPPVVVSVVVVLTVVDIPDSGESGL